jgi:cytochrome c oxidase cbb3-type subunit 3
MPRAPIVFIVAALFTTACEQESKSVRQVPPGGVITQGVPQTELQPGPMIPVRRMPNPYAGNAHAIGEGKKLYGQYNCSGCHANGGGAIGPPLMDDKWIYGSAAENIFATIVEGRPQGMPAFGGRIVEYQIWQIVAYVRSLSGLDTDTAAKPLTQQAQQEQAVDEAKQ